MSARDRLAYALQYGGFPVLVDVGGDTIWTRENVADAILAADPQLAEAIELGLAWQRVEAALPDRTFGVTGRTGGWQAWAHGVAGASTGPTPTAALNALAEKLTRDFPKGKTSEGEVK